MAGILMRVPRLRQSLVHAVHAKNRRPSWSTDRKLIRRIDLSATVDFEVRRRFITRSSLGTPPLVIGRGRPLLVKSRIARYRGKMTCVLLWSGIVPLQSVSGRTEGPTSDVRR